MLYMVKKMENLISKIDVGIVSNEKDYSKWLSKPSCMSHKISDNDMKDYIILLLELSDLAIRVDYILITIHNSFFVKL